MLPGNVDLTFRSHTLNNFDTAQRTIFSLLSFILSPIVNHFIHDGSSKENEIEFFHV